jgi:hypothetical protein
VILTRKNKEGFIYAYFDYDIVDHKGMLCDQGNFMFVKDLWVHPTFSGDTSIRDFIRELEIDKKNRDVLWIYWTREKRGLKVSKSFRRATALRRLQWVGQTIHNQRLQ